jgi:two-component system response regulator RegA
MTNLLDQTRTQCPFPTSKQFAPSVLIVLDDDPVRQCLSQAMQSLGFKVVTAESISDGLAKIKLCAPTYAVVDVRVDDGCGLDIISALKQQRPHARAVIFTSYGNIATAVRAVKLGAIDYLVKPADADDVVSALLAPEGRKAAPPNHPMSADRVRWEHIQYVYEAYGRNVSEAARRLNMHRRSLQRVLAKRAPYVSTTGTVNSVVAKEATGVLHATTDRFSANT